MALIACYECGRQISDKARSCPSCGAPSEKLNVVSPAAQLIDEPKEVVYNENSDTFQGTRYLMVKLAMKAVQELGWKIDQTNDSIGLVTFQTAISWGSFSGVSCSLNIEEIKTNIYKVNGSGKQNSSGYLAVDFGEAKSKADKAINKMKELAIKKNTSNLSKYPDVNIVNPSWEFGSYRSKVHELNRLIKKELNRVFMGGMTDEIFERLAELCNTRDDALYLLKTYDSIYRQDLVENLKSLNSSFAAIKRNLSMFIDHGILGEEYPHKPIKD